MKQAFRRPKPGKLPQSTGAKANAPAGPKGPNWALLAVVIVSTGVITYLLCEYVVLSKVPVGMLGAWVVVKSDPDPASVGDFMEFQRDGSVHLKFSSGEEVQGKAKVEEDRLLVFISDLNNRSRPAIVLSYLIIAVGDDKMELERDRIEGISGSTLQLERPSATNMEPTRPKR